MMIKVFPFYCLAIALFPLEFLRLNHSVINNSLDLFLITSTSILVKNFHLKKLFKTFGGRRLLQTSNCLLLNNLTIMINKIKQKHMYYYGNSYKLAYVFFLPNISLESLNINFMAVLHFLNENIFIIFTGSLLLALLIYMSEKSNTSNTKPSSNNYYNVNFGNGGAGSNNNPSNSNSNNNNDKPITSPGVAASLIIGTFATAATKIVKTNPRAAVATVGVGATVGAGVYVAGEMIYAFKEDKKHIRDMHERMYYHTIERSGSPPPDGNFKFNSPNENGNNFVEFIYKLFENPQYFFNLANEYLTGSDGNPTPALILVIFSFAFWGIVCCLFLIISMLSKQFKIEEREFIKNRPLLHKLVCFMISLRDFNNFVLLILTLFCFIGILILCYYLNDLFWFADLYK